MYTDFFGQNLVTPEDQRTFARDGVVCLRGILNKDCIEQLAGAIDDIVSDLDNSITGYNVSALAQKTWSNNAENIELTGKSKDDLAAFAEFLKASKAHQLKDRLPPTKQKPGNFYIDTSTWKRSDSIREVVLDSVLPQIAAELLQSSRINYFDDQVFVKEPFAADRTAFHQDISYFNVTGHKGCVMWVCVDRATSRSGGLSYIRGSHLWDTIYKANAFITQTPYPEVEGKVLPDIEGHLDEYDIIQIDTEPGDVVIHHFSVIHGAGGNLTDQPRRALSLHYAGDDIRFCEKPGVPPQPHHTHQLTDGSLLDCEDFPVVWPKPFPGCPLSLLYAQSIPHLPPITMP